MQLSPDQTRLRYGVTERLHPELDCETGKTSQSFYNKQWTFYSYSDGLKYLCDTFTLGLCNVNVNVFLTANLDYIYQYSILIQVVAVVTGDWWAINYLRHLRITTIVNYELQLAAPTVLHLCTLSQLTLILAEQKGWFLLNYLWDILQGPLTSHQSTQTKH